jgi:5'-nucleotidase / UDP-sugar diphosphatase
MKQVDLVRAAILILTLGSPLCAEGQSPAPAPISRELHFTILHTSDEHSALVPSPYVEYRRGMPDRTTGGFARLATAVEAERARKRQAGEPVLLTSAGDNIGGTPFSWLILDGAAPELTLMREIGYDVITLGNHEFDYDSERLAGSQRSAGYPAAAGLMAIVATNTRPPAGHPLGATGIRNTHVIDLPNGVRVGFIGLIGEGAQRFAPGAAPVEFIDARAAAAAAVPELRRAGAQVIIALTHSGLREDRALARAVPDIDVILGGHDHRLIEEPIHEGRTLIVHPGSDLRQLVRVELAFDPTTGTVRVRNDETAAPWIVALDASVREDERILGMIDEFTSRVERRIGEWSDGAGQSLSQVITQSESPLRYRPAMSETSLGNFVTDAMRAAAERVTGRPVHVAVLGSGQLRGDVTPGATDWNRGQVVLHDLLGVVSLGAGNDDRPGYPLVAVWLTGDELRRVLEVSVLLSELLGPSYYLQVSGLRARYAPARALWGRIPFKGTPLPSGRAVLSAEREDGARLVPLERGDTTLYHVVTDRYVASFLPTVGRLLPSFMVTPKDAAGRPIADLDSAIVLLDDGSELKVWRAVLDWAIAPGRGEEGTLRDIASYATGDGRLQRAAAAPLWIIPAGGAVLLVGGISAAGVAMRRRARSRIAA